ncbi:cytochrome P-450 cyp509A1 [Chlamydoabsidia padenii]|nr:cytochrome P-450 cyp509A1 [Chlamydoabsidia padenii]
MSQLVDTVNHYAGAIDWSAFNNWYSRYLEKYTNTRGKRFTIMAAVALILLCRSIYRRITPPKNLRHIPHVKFWATVNHFMIKKFPTSVTFRHLNRPHVKANESMYLRWDRNGWVVQVANPEAVKQIFMKSDMFPKMDTDHLDGTFFNQFVGTSNILLLNGHEWKKHRKLANPAFHRSMPVKLFGESARDLFTMLDNDYQGNNFTLDFGHLMERWTLDIIGRAGFGFNFNAVSDKNTSEWKKVYDEVTVSLRSPFFALFPIVDQKFMWLFPKRQEQYKNLQKFRDMLRGVIDHKRKVLQETKNGEQDDAEKDLLTLMIESEKRGEGVLSDEELMGDLGIFFVAGHDTTSFALSAAIYYMAKYPDVQEKARQEVNSILCPNGEEKRDVLPTVEQTKEFVYLNQIIKETLRINGSVVTLITPRRATADVTLSNVFIPKDTLVNVNIYDLHHNPNVWDDPETFNPDRFKAGGEADQKAGSGMSWVPFANGSRQCIGQNFSLAEQRVLLSVLLRHYTWNLPENSEHNEELITGNSLIMASKNLQIQFHKRF